MTPPNGGAAFFRFSTDNMPPHERARAVREMHERSTLPIKPEPMEPLPDQRVRVNVTQWALPGLGVMSGALCGLRQQIEPQHSAPMGADDAFLAFTWGGVSVVTQRSDEVIVRDGDAFLAIRGAKGISVARPKSVRFIGLRFPLTALSSLVPDLHHSEARVLPCGTDALKLLRKYLSLIAQESALTTSELQRAAVIHVYDLAAVALGTAADRADLARHRGVRAARLETIKADVIAHLGDGDLSVAMVAGRQRVSPRYLRKCSRWTGPAFPNSYSINAWQRPIAC